LGGSDCIDQSVSSESDGIVQRKMIPWRSLLPEVKYNDDAKVRRSVGKLIVVTSLVDRIPNLGGLCQSCEIFGVSKFVIGNLRYLDDKNFERLSVTAQKWMHIDEVRQEQLLSYLLDVKSQGYTVVGAEQTDSGQSLCDFRFPRNTVLLLGNEKSGIPAEFLQVVDVCVEIPQSGVVRSLNVHVSGAIFVWEYYKQCSLQQTLSAE
jgi:tRNA G18 (ribose-2'-O)-methylase SpoU